MTGVVKVNRWLSLFFETPLRDPASEKLRSISAVFLSERELGEKVACKIIALWAAKSDFRQENRREKKKQRLDGGEGEIRTHGRVSPTHAFQACSLNRSDTSPQGEPNQTSTNFQAEENWRSFFVSRSEFFRGNSEASEFGEGRASPC
jgi:hypothetical protein